MTDVEMINAMCNMQKKLDKSLLEKGKALGKIEAYDRERTTFALIDELGELVHELKGQWCWWKATQKTVERAKVLEELVDAWHFGLSLDNHNPIGVKLADAKLYKGESNLITYYISKIVEYADKSFVLVTQRLYSLTYALGFTMKDVYQGYIKKNKENYARIERGY